MAIDTLLAYVGVYGDGCWQGPQPVGRSSAQFAGHAAAGMSRHDLKELGEHLDAGQAGLVVVAVADMGAKVFAGIWSLFHGVGDVFKAFELRRLRQL